MNHNNSYIFLKTWVETKNPRTIEEAFYYFITNSNIELQSDESAYGLVYKCSFLREPHKSPYFYIDSEGFIDNVLHIIIKLVLVAEENIIFLGKTPVKLEWKYIKDKQLTTVLYQSTRQFIEEVGNQQEIYRKGIENLHRNTPILLFSDILDPGSLHYQEFIRILLQNTVEKQPLHQMFSEFHKITRIQPREHLLQSNHFSFGILAMEYIGYPYILCNNIVTPIIFEEIKGNPENKDIHKYDSQTLASKSKRLRWIYNIRRYELLRLAIDTGYSQGDYHSENMFIDEKNKRAMIIDFGSAKEIHSKKMCETLWNKLVKEKFTNEIENFLTIELILAEIYNTHHVDSTTKEFTEYTWIKAVEKIDIQQIILLHEIQKYNKKDDELPFLQYFSRKRFHRNVNH
jgi:serine/threonine protein kinase